MQKKENQTIIAGLIDERNSSWDRVYNPKGIAATLKSRDYKTPQLVMACKRRLK